MHWSLEFDLSKGDLYQYWYFTFFDFNNLIDFNLTITFAKPSVLTFSKDMRNLRTQDLNGVCRNLPSVF